MKKEKSMFQNVVETAKIATEGWGFHLRTCAGIIPVIGSAFAARGIARYAGLPEMTCNQIALAAELVVGAGWVHNTLARLHMVPPARKIPRRVGKFVGRGCHYAKERVSKALGIGGH